MKLNKPAKSLIEPLTLKWQQQRDFLDSVGATFAGLAIDRLEKQKADPMGRKWKPWASSTAKARRKEGSSGTGLLLRTGALRDSIEYEVQGPKVVIRSRSSYAEFLQNGTSRMPARPFLGTGPREEREMKRIWNQWIEK